MTGQGKKITLALVTWAATAFGGIELLRSTGALQITTAGDSSSSYQAQSGDMLSHCSFTNHRGHAVVHTKNLTILLDTNARGRIHSTQDESILYLRQGTLWFRSQGEQARLTCRTYDISTRRGLIRLDASDTGVTISVLSGGCKIFNSRTGKITLSNHGRAITFEDSTHGQFFIDVNRQRKNLKTLIECSEYPLFGFAPCQHAHEDTSAVKDTLIPLFVQKSSSNRAGYVISAQPGPAEAARAAAKRAKVVLPLLTTHKRTYLLPYRLHHPYAVWDTRFRENPNDSLSVILESSLFDSRRGAYIFSHTEVIPCSSRADTLIPRIPARAGDSLIKHLKKISSP
ncbi:MAG: hypothetical protein ACQEQV_10790 [Fibrobacterota bacterium]